ncbi:MAG: DoxX family protein [Roseococcus sp.]|nr:DoxX family protein [Roseococcus sp.]
MPSTQITTPYAALLLRLSLGTILLAHGAWLKLGVFGLAGTMGYFGSIGYPPVFGALVAFGETAAGLALITGVLLRPAALLSLPILIGATLAHAGNGWLFSAPNGGWEFPAFLTLAMLVQAGLGAGAHALDLGRLLGRTPVASQA